MDSILLRDLSVVVWKGCLYTSNSFGFFHRGEVSGVGC